MFILVLDEIKYIIGLRALFTAKLLLPYMEFTNQVSSSEEYIAYQQQYDKKIKDFQREPQTFFQQTQWKILCYRSMLQAGSITFLQKHYRSVSVVLGMCNFL